MGRSYPPSNDPGFRSALYPGAAAPEHWLATLPPVDTAESSVLWPGGTLDFAPAYYFWGSLGESFWVATWQASSIVLPTDPATAWQVTVQVSKYFFLQTTDSLWVQVFMLPANPDTPFYSWLEKWDAREPPKPSGWLLLADGHPYGPAVLNPKPFPA